MHDEAIWAVNPHYQLYLAHIGDTKTRVEQANEGADGARRIVVLGFARQQGAAAFKIAQVQNWHAANCLTHPLEGRMWNLILTAWMMGWMGWMGWFLCLVFGAIWAPVLPRSPAAAAIVCVPACAGVYGGQAAV